MDATLSPAPAKPLTHGQTLFIILGVLLPVFMGSLDQTILAGALPSIGRDFGDVHNLPWLVTTYLIAATATTPLYGKLADIHGRKATLLVAVLFYFAGSLLCALAPNMAVLILGRTLAGLGGGGLTSLGMIVLGDIAAPKDRAKYYAYYSIIYTTSGACGPLLGGFLADHVHWSAIFWLNIPLAVIGLALIFLCLDRLPRHERPHRLDFLGAGLIVVATVAFMLALNVGGVRHAWTSPPVLVLLAAAALVGGGFVLRLATAPEPLIPLSILRDPVARYAIITNVFGWGPIIGLNIFLPMYLQSVMGFSPTGAGLLLIMLMTTLNISAGLASPVIGWARHYKTLPLIGLVVTIASILALAWWADRMTPLWFEVLLFLIGIGFGPIAPLATVALQNTVATHQFGTAIGTMNFSRMLLTTVLAAVFGALVAASIGKDGLSLAASPAEVAAAARGFGMVFFAAAACQMVALVSLLLMEEKPLRTGTA